MPGKFSSRHALDDEDTGKPAVSDHDVELMRPLQAWGYSIDVDLGDESDDPDPDPDPAAAADDD